MFARHGTLTGSNTVDTITVTSLTRPVSHIAVSLRANDSTAWFTVATNGATADTPAANGNDVFALGPAHPVWSVPVGTTSSVQVKIVSADAVVYSIHGH